MLITAWPSLPTALTHTHTQTQRMTGCPPPRVEVKYARVASLRIICMLEGEGGKERERATNQYPEWSQVVCMCLFLLMC